MPIAERADNRDALLAAVVTVAAAAPLTGALAMLVAGAPVAWLWLAVCASATVPPVVWFAARGRLFEPLPILLAVAALMFVARPLQLFLSWESLYSYLLTQDPVQTLTLLEAQEVALYVTERLRDPLDAALGRAQGACALFLVALLAGYWLAGRAPLRNGLASLNGPSAFNQRAAIGISLVIGLAAQTALIVRAGGPVAALEGAVAQTASSDSFVLFVLAGFSTAALVIWVAWRRPRRRLEQLLLAVSIGTVSTLWILTGSRARVFVTLLALVVIVNYLWRRWRMRELLVCGLLLLVFASSVVVLRTVAGEENLSEGVSASADHLLDERVILNDLTAFDNVLVATAIYGRERPHEHGGFFVDAVRSYVPRRIDAGKPEGGDILFRRVIWGERFIAGRPPSAVGDFFIDFGLWGVALGALLLGAVCRFLLALPDPRRTGREYRVALFALLMVVLYEFLVGTLSIAIGFALTLVLPFLVAAQVFGRLPGGRPATAETRG